MTLLYMLIGTLCLSWVALICLWIEYGRKGGK